MRTLLLGGILPLALAAATGSASATTFSYMGPGLTYAYEVPETGTYHIEAIGAGGGTGNARDGSDAARGGFGLYIEDNFALTAGENLNIAVGGQGSNSKESIGPAGGGGGSFVVGPNDTPLLIAGGGGGGAVGGNNSDSRGVSATSEAATKGNSAGLEHVDGGAAGSSGNGGDGGPTKSGDGYGGGGGGGFSGAGGCGGTCVNAGGGGGSFLNGLAGGTGGAGNGGTGGFGGGGGGGYLGGGGGGGGYNGGGGGAANQDEGGGGGAGGSFDASGAPSYGPVTTIGDGSVTITEVSGLDVPAPVPEPASLALFGTGLAGFGLIRRRRRGWQQRWAA